MPAAEAAGDIISSSEAAELLGPLASYRHVALAVSGGSDSMALMWLAANWARHTNAAPRLSVVSVDHGLRPGSAEEARHVAERAQGLGLEAAVLQWHGDKPATGVQARAREARYDLLTRWCGEHAADALATAHSMDDQAETVLMRLARGSGVDGLAAMRTVRAGPLPVLRPLLGVPRARLRATLAAAGQDWIEDPSNEDPRYERIRWRKALATLGEVGLTPAMIALSAHRLERARVALEDAASRLEARAVTHAAGHATIDTAALEDVPEEIVLRLLQRLVMRYGADEPVKLAALERLSAWIAAGEGRGRTLAGCRIERRSGAVRIGPQPPRQRQ